MTIPAPVRIPLLVLGPAALLALLGSSPGAPGAGFGREAAAVSPVLLLLILVGFSHFHRRRNAAIVDALASGAGMALVFLWPLGKIGGFFGAIDLARFAIVRGWPGRERLAGEVAAGLVIPLLAALDRILPSRAQRLMVRSVSLPVSVFLAAAWCLAAPGPAFRPAGAAWSWAQGWPDAVAAGAVLGILLLREIVWSRLLRRELSEEVAIGIIPADHLAILSSPWRRHTRRWWPDRAERRVYVQTVLQLALRRAQMRGLEISSQRIAQLEVLRLRERIRTILAPIEPPLESTLGGRATERSHRVIEVSAPDDLPGLE